MGNLDKKLRAMAARHKFSIEAVESLASALRVGGGKSAQFNHPELGGMGQWMPGMLMIGDMFNAERKQRVQALINDLLAIMPELAVMAAGKAGMQEVFGSGIWWPPSLGKPSATGAQNEMRYAYFASDNRLAVKVGKTITVYDSTGYRITGVSQKQIDGQQVILFGSPQGNFDLSVLKVIEVRQA